MNTDVLIIGSGVAAAAIASRLLEADPQRDILILEAGQWQWIPGAFMDEAV